MTRLPILAALALALAGCGGKDARTDNNATAGGEVLPGSASDAMLPLDTVRSQAPAAPRVEGTGKPKAGDKAEASDAAPAVEAAEPAEPAAPAT